MFQSISGLKDDDLELDTSFAPIFSSTQGSKCTKRGNETPIQEEQNSKKIKVDDKLQSIKSPFVRNYNANCDRDNSICSPNRVVKRMFPGPAGLLTDLNLKQNSEITFKNVDDKEDFLFCSQQTVSTFTDRPWKMMKDDYYSLNGEQLFEKYTISWIKKNFSHNKVLNSYKAPFLAAIIQNLDTIAGKIPTVHVTLKDTTGTIDGTILYSFYKENSTYLTLGSIIVLKQFGVLTSQEGHCLTITSNNLLAIYHVRDPNCKKETLEGDPFEKIIFKDCRPDEIWKESNSVSILQNATNNLKTNNNKLTFSNIYNKPFISAEKKSTSSKTLNNIRSSVSVQNCSFPETNIVSNINFLLPTSKVAVSNTSCSGSSEPKSINNFEIFGCQNVDEKKKFNFKKLSNEHQQHVMKSNIEDNVTLRTNVSSAKTDNDTDIWEKMLEDIDMDSLFDEF